MKLAHIINPVDVDRSSDLFVAQPIVFRSMYNAQIHCPEDVRVGLYYTAFAEDDVDPGYSFEQLPSLRLSIQDFARAEDGIAKKLPLIGEILGSLLEHTDAEYLIYTNADIILHPTFYAEVVRLIDQGFDALSITRRTIPNVFSSPGHLDLITRQHGESHYGYDCFIFSREVLQRFVLEPVCLGVPGIGRLLICNCFVFSANFKLARNLKLTFHIGDERRWKTSREAGAQHPVVIAEKISARGTLRALEKLRSHANTSQKQAALEQMIEDELNRQERIFGRVV